MQHLILLVKTPFFLKGALIIAENPFSTFCFGSDLCK